ncbi:MAG: hypothetical protein GXO16_03255 [Epsilonproteobacteria bacterium]|nr:hypothetical protein [Campylobacterota bacterium]
MRYLYLSFLLSSLVLADSGLGKVLEFLEKIDDKILEDINTSSLPTIKEVVANSTTREIPTIKELTIRQQKVAEPKKRATSTRPSRPKPIRRKKRSFKPALPPKTPKEFEEITVVATLVSDDGTKVALTADGAILKEHSFYKNCYIDKITLLHIRLRCKNRTYFIKVGK